MRPKGKACKQGRRWVRVFYFNSLPARCNYETEEQVEDCSDEQDSYDEVSRKSTSQEGTRFATPSQGSCGTWITVSMNSREQSIGYLYSDGHGHGM